MAYSNIKYAVEDQVATITLTRPEVKNAFNDVMLDEPAPPKPAAKKKAAPKPARKKRPKGKS